MTILSDLNAKDHFSIVEFDSSVKTWLSAEDKEIESNCWENFKKVSGWKRKIDDSGREHFMSPCGDYIKGRL